MTNASSSIVQLAVAAFNTHHASKPDDVKHLLSEHLTRVHGVIDNHSGLADAAKDDLKASAALFNAGVMTDTPAKLNAIDVVYGKGVANIMHHLAQNSITDESTIGPACALIMALNCANLEGTVAKLGNPATRTAGMVETGGINRFKDYMIDINQERLMLTGYGETPGLLKYEIQLIDKVAIALGLKIDPAATPAYELFGRKI